MALIEGGVRALGGCRLPYPPKEPRRISFRRGGQRPDSSQYMEHEHLEVSSHHPRRKLDLSEDLATANQILVTIYRFEI
jgi:hypothetical protein